MINHTKNRGIRQLKSLNKLELLGKMLESAHSIYLKTNQTLNAPGIILLLVALCYG